MSKRQFQAAAAALPLRRADLLALQAGYQSQEQRLREAVLAQFPSMSAGVEQSKSSEEGIYSSGFTVNITLPIFNRNRGNIAIEKATRLRLHDAYAARLVRAHADVERILQDQALHEHERGASEQAIALMARTLNGADAALARGDLSETDYVLLKTAWLDRRLDLLGRGQTLLEQRAALQNLLGGPLPS